MKTIRIVFRYFCISGLISLQFSHAKAQIYNWSDGIAGTGSAKSKCMQIDDEGNIYTTGYISHTVDFDPGAGIANRSSAGLFDIFVAKYNAEGEYIKAMTFGSSASESGEYLTIDNSGNVYIIGEFRNTVDFDPGPGVFTLTSSPVSGDIFLAKYTADLNFIWAKSFISISSDEGLCVTTDSNADVFVSLKFDATIDIDPGAGEALFTSGGLTTDLLLAKYDSTGNYITATQITSWGNAEFNEIYFDKNEDLIVTGFYDDSLVLTASGTTIVPGPGFYNYFLAKFDHEFNFLWFDCNSVTGGEDWGLGVETDMHNNIYVTGYFSDSLNLYSTDLPGSTLYTGGQRDIFLIKYNEDGEYQWAIRMGGNFWDEANDVAIDANGYVYVTGKYSFVADLDPSPALGLLLSYSEDIFLACYDSLGNYKWAFNTQGSDGSSEGKDIVIKNGELTFTGHYSGFPDFDPGPATATLSGSDFWNMFIANYTIDSCNNLDLAINDITDVTCADSGYANAVLTNGTPPYTYEWDTPLTTETSYIHVDHPGVFTVTAADSTLCKKQSSAYISGPAYTIPDLNSFLFAEEPFRPGFQTTLQTAVFNEGCMPLSGSYQVILDPLIELESVFPAPDISSGDTLTWIFSALDYYSDPIHPVIHVQTPVGSAMGDTVLIVTNIIPSGGEEDSTNNYHEYIFEITDSYAPCTKQVYPLGEGTGGLIPNNEMMTYTLQFQNTGTAEAENILIVDTLDENLDISTFHILGASHLMTVNVYGNVIQFYFEGIHLPDSISNEPESHGYIVFEIMQDSNLTEGTQIENSALVLFDLGLPEITNTVVNTISLCSEFELEIAALTNETCLGDMDGSAEVFVSGGLEPYTYNWNTEPLQTDNLAVNLTQGTYEIEVADVNGCILTDTIIVESNPVYDTLIDTMICEGLLYTFPDGSVSVSSVIQTSYLHTINGCDSIITTDLTVIPVPEIPAISASGATTFCEGETVTLTSSYASGNTWSNGAVSSSIIVDESGVYSVSYAYECGIVISGEIIITVDPLPETPEISTSGSTVICSGEPLMLTSSVTDNITWNTGEHTESIIVSDAGDYFVTATNDCGASVSSVITVTVNEAPLTPVIYADGATEFCEGDSVLLTSSNTEGNMWNTGDTTQSILVGSTGVYTVTTVNDCGEETSDPVSVLVYPHPEAEITVDGELKFCDGDSVILQAPSGDYTYLWSTGAITESISVLISNDVFVIVTDVNGCSSVSAEVTVESYPNPPAPLITNSNDTLYTTEGYSYQWYFEGVLIPGASDSYYVATDGGNYSVEITDINGCFANSETFYYSGLGINGTYNADQSLSIFPNPNSGNYTLILNSTCTNKFNIYMYNAVGQLILIDEGNLINDLFARNFNVSDLPKGNYLVKVVCDNEAHYKKVTIQ